MTFNRGVKPNVAVQVLVAALRADIALARQMNIQTPCLIANQADGHGYEQRKEDFGLIEVLTTPTRGVGINRNIAMLHATSDFVLLADDDVVYDEGYEEIILDSFERYPDAGALIFNLDQVGETSRTIRTIRKAHRLHLHNGLSYGAYRIAVRRSVISRHNISFSLLFGGGARYGSGEDSLFLADCIRAGVVTMAIPARIGTVDLSSSTWFQGYNRRYLFDKGALYAALSGRGSRFLCVALLWRLRNELRPALNWLEAYRAMREGSEDLTAHVNRECRQESS